MLRFRKAKNDAVTGFLGAQTEFTGKLSFEGIVHLDGHFQGEIISRGTLVVGPDSIVEAEIHSNSLKISGEVRGDITATEKIELYPPAKVYGNIRTPSLIIEEGVIFEGICSMSSFQPEMPELERKESEMPLEEEEPEEGISAQAWPLGYDQNDSLSGEDTENETLHKHDR